ncbi:alpha/beta fold hydrolase [Streptomyces sp. WY228]|uniref:alpha/beta fold hydrolase n=1 Tax=Streptomyces sp. WY228 TaxID=2855836 RepID=UPI001C4F43F2|nr:alpha/beta hydrolase [Streptomyces sp. WY228]QXR00264.1 alpha/beta hydrolase [Streptomyces sp. WY228]
MTAPDAGEVFLTAEDGGRIAVSVLRPLEHGGDERPVVVLAHGWGGGRRIWSLVTDRLLRGGFPVVAYDLRGHGASTVGSLGVTSEAMTADLATVLSYAGDAPIVVGHSGGGFAALAQAAGSGPDAGPAGLVLVASAAHDQDTPEKEAAMMEAPLFSWALRRPALGRLLLGQMTGTALDSRLREVNRQVFAGTAPTVRAACFRSSRGMDLRAAQASVRVPVAVLAGEKDKVIRPELGRELAAALPDATFTLLPGAGHVLPLESPDAVVAAVLRVHGASAGRSRSDGAVKRTGSR